MRLPQVKLKVIIEKAEDGYLCAECPSIPGCVSQGKTIEEALQNITQAIKECLEVRKELNMPLITEFPKVEVVEVSV